MEIQNIGKRDIKNKKIQPLIGNEIKILYRLEDYNSLKGLLKDLITTDSKIVNLGCGNAEFSENMYDDGFVNIKNIDISEVVITQMAARNLKRPKMSYEVMDVKSLKYPDNSFDIAIDKSTIDALLCGEDSFYNVALMIKVIIRS
jgi:2-polyprenyl-3-methyl-5-hydroxy-6-metoxy-1,4-benzoquinol methylase